MFEFLIDFDTRLLLWFNSFHSPFWDFFMSEASGRKIWIGLYVAIVCGLWIRYGLRSMLLVLVATALTVFIADQATATYMRPFFGRLRPSNLENPISEFIIIVNEYRAGAFGFPSSHAANTVAVATLLSLIIRNVRFTVMICLWSLLNCYSRMYLGVHYPGDLMVGACFGAAVGLTVYYLVRYVYQNCRIFRSISDSRDAKSIIKGKYSVRFSASDIPIAVFILTLLYICFCYILQ